MKMFGGARPLPRLLWMFAVTLAVRDAAAQFILSTNNGQIAIAGYFPNTTTSVSIPSTVGGLPVTSIGAGAFSGFVNLTNVIIPAGVTNIGSGAFGNCIRLPSLVLPANLLTLGNGALEYCTNLATVTLPASVSSIGLQAFLGCYSLTAINVDPANTSFSGVAGVLFNATQTVLLTYPPGKAGVYAIPSTVTNISQYAFNNCARLPGVTIPASVQIIGAFAFTECTGLTSVLVPGTVTNLGTYAFDLCTGLTNATLNLPLGAIPDGLFLECTNLAGVGIPGSATSIGDQAFAYCSSLTNVSLPSHLLSIGQQAFYQCASISNVVIPVPVNFIGVQAFDGCYSLTSISIGTGGALVYSTQNGVLFNYAGTTLIQYPGGLAGSYAIPPGVTNIDQYSFALCPRLTGVTIPSSVTTIGQSAFGECSNLTSVTIPATVTNMGYGAFGDCSRLTNLTLASGLTVIGPSAFVGCTSLPSVTIPGSISNFGTSAFQDCDSLTQVTISSGVTSIPVNCFEACTNLLSVAIPSTVTNIAGQAFVACFSLGSITVDPANAFYSSDPHGVLFDKTQTTLIQCPQATAGAYTIPATVTSIADQAFEDCVRLTNIVIPSSVTNMGFASFGDCVGLTSIAIPGTVASLGSQAFIACTSLTNAFLSNGVASIASSAFSSCTSLVGVTIPASVTNIGIGPFFNCSSLEGITVNPANANYSSWYGVLFDKSQQALLEYPPGRTGAYAVPWGVTSIAQDAFSSCQGLTSVTIPPGLLSIQDGAFFNSTNLGSALFEGNAPAMLGNVFTAASPDFTVLYLTAATGFSSPVWIGSPNDIYSATQLALGPPLALAVEPPNAVQITWPAPFTGFQLYQSKVLNSTNWTSVTNLPTATNGWNEVTIQNAGGTLFFRLIHP